MNYSSIYNNLIQHRKNCELPEHEAHEVHHIVPVAHGGTNKKENLVKLTPREHYIAHRLLYKIYKDKSMLYALWIMSHTRDGIKISSRTYQRLKEDFSSANTGKNNPMYGKPSKFRGVPRTQEVRDKISQSLTGRTISKEACRKISEAKAGGVVTEEHRQKISSTLTGVKKTSEHAANISKGKSGNPYGPMKDDHKQKISSSLKGKVKSEEHLKKIADAIKGKKKGPLSPEIKRALSQNPRCSAHTEVESTCPHCGKTGKGNAMKRWHFDNCKKKT